ALTPAQIRAALLDSTIDIEAPGVDRDTGAGIVMAHAALDAIGATPKALLSAAPVPSEILGDGDAFIEPNETWNLAVALTNIGGATATAIGATLSTSTPGVTITTAAATWDDLAPGASGNAHAPFAFRVDSDAACGATIDFALTVTFYGNSTQTIRFSLPTGEPGAPVTFSYSGAVVAIPDGLDLSGHSPGAVAFAPIDVSGLAGAIYAATISIDGSACTSAAGATTVGIDHPFVSDLLIGLVAPDGSALPLIANVGDGGNNFCHTVLDDSAAASIQGVTGAQAPFIGTFRPDAPLSTLRGKNPNGTWQLRAQDFLAQDSGHIRAFSLHLTPAACNAPARTTVIHGTKTVSGAFRPGGHVTYAITLTNSGNTAQADNAGHEFTDVLPSALMLTGANASAGTVVFDTATNTVNWDGALAPSASVTITIDATIGAVNDGTVVSNQGTIRYDSDGDAVNDAEALTDDPALPGPADATTFTVVRPPAPHLRAQKTIVGGNRREGGDVVYAIVLANDGGGAQGDNPGDEFVDVLPPELSLATVSATSGIATAALATNTVAWNGAIPAGGSVTITIAATIRAGTGGRPVSNQGTVFYDANGGGTNSASIVTDDPNSGGANDPTIFVVIRSAPVIPAPMLSPFALCALSLMILATACVRARNRMR
ncbi:MAG TPA: proprotein convertase P-domain-containing protein, partial [Rudaea sp.]